MGRRCGICGYSAKDAGDFVEHMDLVHQWKQVAAQREQRWLHPLALALLVALWFFGLPILMPVLLRRRDDGLDLRKPDHAVAVAMVPVMAAVLWRAASVGPLILRRTGDYQLDSFSNAFELIAANVVLLATIGLVRWMRLPPSSGTPPTGSDHQFLLRGWVTAVVVTLVAVGSVTTYSASSARTAASASGPPVIRDARPSASPAESATHRTGRVLSNWAMTNPSNGPNESDIDCLRGRYVSGGFQLTLKQACGGSVDSRSLPGDTGEAVSFRVEVDASFISEPARAPTISVFCLYSEHGNDWDRHYSFAISPDGTHSIFRTLRRESSPTILNGSTSPSSAVRAASPNHIQADCLQEGDSLSLVLTVNQIELIRGSDDRSLDPRSIFGEPGVALAGPAGFASVLSNFRVTEMLPVQR